MKQESFFQDHDVHPQGIYVVEVFSEGKEVRRGIFSIKQKAENWMGNLPDAYTCVVTPYVIDEPEFGNVAKRDMQ